MDRSWTDTRQILAQTRPIWCHWYVWPGFEKKYSLSDLITVIRRGTYILWISSNKHSYKIILSSLHQHKSYCLRFLINDSIRLWIAHTKLVLFLCQNTGHRRYIRCTDRSSIMCIWWSEISGWMRTVCQFHAVVTSKIKLSLWKISGHVGWVEA